MTLFNPIDTLNAWRHRLYASALPSDTLRAFIVSVGADVLTWAVALAGVRRW